MVAFTPRPIPTSVADTDIGEVIRTCSICHISVTDVSGDRALPVCRCRCSIHTATGIGVGIGITVGIGLSVNSPYTLSSGSRGGGGLGGLNPPSEVFFLLVSI